MSKHVVVGAGAVGQATARELVAQGHKEVLLVSRSGTGPEVASTERVARRRGRRCAAHRPVRR